MSYKKAYSVCTGLTFAEVVVVLILFIIKKFNTPFFVGLALVVVLAAVSSVIMVKYYRCPRCNSLLVLWSRKRKICPECEEKLDL